MSSFEQEMSQAAHLLAEDFKDLCWQRKAYRPGGKRKRISDEALEDALFTVWRTWLTSTARPVVTPS